MSELRRSAQALQTMLQDPDADLESVRELADELAGALANGGREWPTPEQALALGRLMADRPLQRAQVGPGGVMYLPTDYVAVHFADSSANGFDCGIAPDGRVSS